MIRHWEMIDHKDHPMNTFDLSHIPVLFWEWIPLEMLKLSF